MAGPDGVPSTPAADEAPTSSAPPPADAPRPWPFFAPSPTERISAALDLAEVGPGRRVCDLGCGDGRVLVAAASRGAEVVGMELDRALVARAREALEAAGHGGDVQHGDLLVDPLPSADVYVTFLSPAVLQRLVARLEAEKPSGERSRLVSVVYRAAGLVPTRSAGGCHLHEIPGLPRPRPVGWNAAGLVVVTHDRHDMLSYALAGHPGGPVHLEVRGPAAAEVATMTGADSSTHPREIAVDLRWSPGTDPSPRFGELHLEGVGPLRLLATGSSPELDGVVPGDNEGTPGSEGLTPESDGVREHRTGPQPEWWWVDEAEWDALVELATRRPDGFDPGPVIAAARLRR